MSTRTRPRKPPQVRSVRVSPGLLEVLSVGRGHLKLTVTPGDDVELAKARAVIEDMLARGASIFVEQADGSTRRVKRFDPKKMIYYVDPPDVLPPPAAAPAVEATPEPAVRMKSPAKKPRYVPVPVARTKATAVGRTAGG